MTVLRRLSVVVLSLALMAGNPAVCAGWSPTPEARMACCKEHDECRMHARRAHESGHEHAHTQEQADACCAASSRDQSDPLNPPPVTTMSSAVSEVAVILPISTPALVLTDAWRTDAPVPRPPVARHLLLSVFLV